MNEVPLLNYVVLFWGVFVALFQERFGKFQDLSPEMKQLVNAVFAYVVPAAVAWWVNPWWNADWGDPQQFVLALLTFLVPAFAWALGQFTHIFDATATKVRKNLK